MMGFIVLVALICAGAWAYFNQTTVKGWFAKFTGK